MGGAIEKIEPMILLPKLAGNLFSRIYSHFLDCLRSWCAFTLIAQPSTTSMISRFGPLHPVADNLLVFFLTIIYYVFILFTYSLGHATEEDAKNTFWLLPTNHRQTNISRKSISRSEYSGPFRPIDSIRIHIGFQSVVDYVSGVRRTQHIRHKHCGYTINPGFYF